MTDDDAITPDEPEFTSPDDLEIAPDTPENPETDEQESEDQPDADVEVEFEGVKYTVPRTLERALLRETDYTQKSQEVAESKRGVEAEKQRLADWTKAINDDLQEHAQLMSIDNQLREYDKVNWDQLRVDEPDEWTAHRERIHDLRYARQQLVGQMQTKHGERVSKAEAEQATLREQTRATLAREIPNFSPKLEQELTDFAVQSGYDPAEVKAVFDSDPRPVKILHLAYIGQQLVAKQRAASKKPDVPAKPLPRITGGKSSPTSALPKDSDDIATWTRKEQARMARKHA